MVIFPVMAQGRGADKHADKSALIIVTVEFYIILGDELMGFGHGCLGFKNVFAFSQGQ